MDVKKIAVKLNMVATAAIFTSFTWAELPALLAPDEVFLFHVESIQQGQAQLTWQVPAQYYLYHHSIQVQHNQQSLVLDLPPAKALYDENFGHTQVYEQDLSFTVVVQPSTEYQVTWQGCAKDRLCYPPQQITFSTDVNALVNLSKQNLNSPNLLDLTAQHSDSTSTSTSENNMAADQRWFEALAEHSFIYSLILFLGLGILLAFTPCSLPMLPILSSLIVRDRKGMAAWMIALAFVISMALVYATLGLVASSAGLSFQRWLQQPLTLIGFSGLFLLFALNLFGVFELQLPQTMVARLDRLQGMQKGGSLVSASIMGMLSALLVGPCMTAPLAGALLFISQTQQQWQGAILLFTLGFGMGTPLLIASVLGAHFLPKAGQWMHQVKVLFGFIMLAVALYFIRPLLTAGWLQLLSLGLGFSFIGYVAWCIYKEQAQPKWLYWIILVMSIPSVVYSQYRYYNAAHGLALTQVQAWQVARNTTELNQLLAIAQSNQPIVIDVYADWCVACQPIEHRILKSASVQEALTNVTRIKLDLSQYDASHQALLNDREILGPPTYLFLNAEQQEIRSLRLTGAFTEAELRQQLEKLTTQP